MDCKLLEMQFSKTLILLYFGKLYKQLDLLIFFYIYLSGQKISI